MPGFFVPENFSSNKSLLIKDDEFHHIKNVFKKQIGENINLTNGNGSIAVGRILSFSKKECEIEILKVKTFEETLPKIALAFSLLKKKNDELIIEKLTELGVKEFFPFIADRTIRKNSINIISKFKKKSIVAIKQCDNAFLPKINEVENFSKMIKSLIDKNYLPIIASEIEKDKILSEILEENSGKNYCLIIGPEGGFSKIELDYISQNLLSFKLSNHILRAETAAISSVSQLSQILLTKNKKFY